MKGLLKNFIIVIFILLVISGVFALLNPEAFEKSEEIPLSQLAQDIKEDKIEKITVSGSEIILSYTSGEELISRKEVGISLNDSLASYDLSEKLNTLDIVIIEEDEGILGWLLPLSFILPLLLFGFFFLMMFKGSRGGGPGGGGQFSFLKAPAKMFGDNKDGKKTEKITFKDIADLKEAKEEIQEVMDFLKNPKKYSVMGARIPRGVLLVGPPGTGKTMLARAVANESGVPFFSIAGSAFVELFVGVGSARVRSLFAEAKKQSPSLIFIDELDAIGKMRMPGIGGGHDEREQTLNQILAEMDGFERDTGVIIMAATNAPQVLDPALLRAGRFDRRIVFDLPDVKGREEILQIHSRGKPMAMDVNIKEVAERTPGFSGADLANLVNEAAILSARRNKQKIYQPELLESIEKVLLGPERKSHLLSGKEKELSAYHEAGHALVSSTLDNAEEVRKVSIVSRGMAAGYTLVLPKREKRIKTKSEFLAELAVLLAGYATEKIIFKEISTGASNDLEKASIIARALVTKYGMSKLGPVTFGKREGLPFLGWDQESEKNYSESVATQIDKETDRFIKEAEATADKLIRQKINILKRIATTLIEKETIEKDEFDLLVNTKSKKPSTQSSPSSHATPTT